MDIAEFIIRLLSPKKRSGHDRKPAKLSAPERKAPPPAASSSSSSGGGGGGGGGGGDDRRKPDGGVHVSEVTSGEAGPAVHKTTGQIKGKIDAVTDIPDKGGHVLHMTDDRGKKLDVRFGGPLASLARTARSGDDVTIKLDGAHGRASIENRTQASERHAESDGSFTDQPLAPPAPKQGHTQAL